MNRLSVWGKYLKKEAVTQEFSLKEVVL
jgi:hypothetical protein